MIQSHCTQLDGNYTRMLRAALDVSWRSHISNKELYGPLPQVSAVVRSRRLRLAGHVVRHEEMAGQVLLWEPNEPRRRGRPSATLRKRTPISNAGQTRVETQVSPPRG